MKNLVLKIKKGESNMKRIRNRFFILTLLLAFSFTLIGTTRAAVYDTLPTGKNYIDTENVTSNFSSIYIIDDILIKTNTDYTLNIPFVDSNTFFNGNESSIDLIVVGNNGNDFYDSTLNSTNYNSVCSLDTPGYLSCTFNSGTSDYITTIYISTSDDTRDAWDTSNLLQLEEGTVGTVYEVYNGVVDDTVAPVINGGSGLIYQNIDNPDSAATIAATFTATDDTDGTVAITIQTDTYTGNENTLGDYSLILRATDSSGNFTEVDLTIRVVDVVEPIINIVGGTVYVEYGNTYSEPGANVTDNYDSGLTAVITGTVNNSVIGTYTRLYDVSDSSGNAAAQVSRTVVVQDTIAPVQTLTGSSTIYIEFGDNYTEQGATWTDAFDTSGSSISSGSVNVAVLGTYIISYNITDTNGNVATTLTRTVIVQDTTGPVFTGSTSYTWNISLGYNLGYLLSLITANDLYSGVLTDDIIVQSDTFSANNTTLGTYTVVLRATDSSGNYTDMTITINVVDDLPPVFTTTSVILTLDYANGMTQQDIIDYFNNQ